MQTINKELPYVLDFFRENVKDQIFNLKTHKKLYYKLLEHKNDLFNEFKEEIELKWQEFQKENQDRLVKKTYTSFFYENFHDFYKFYLHNFFGFEGNSIEMVLKEKLSDEQLIIEYNYRLSPEELIQYEQTSNKSKGNFPGTLFFTGYILTLTALIGIIIRKIIKEPILLTLDCAIIKNESNSKYLNFLLFVRNEKKEIFTNYYHMILYYFLKQFKGIPDDYYEKLLLGREKVYQLALIEYTSVREKLVNLMYYFYKKCKLLQTFCPLLNFLNFVNSRVEDSVYNNVDIIKREFLDNFNYTTEKKNSIIRIFNFLDKKTILYSTFQANNLPSNKSQFNLFLLYMKYHFSSGLEALEVSNMLYLPEIFKSTLNEHNSEKNVNYINVNTINDIDVFMNYFGIISHIDNIDIVFKKIFNKGVSQLNYKFFRSYLKSFNNKFSMIFEQENKNLAKNPENEPLTFNIIIDLICRMLYTLIDKIFLKSNPNNASKNFNDPRGRYNGNNIALTVLELFIFQEINFSDDIWPEFLVSLNKDKLEEDLGNNVKISKKKFYSDKEIIKFYTTYDLQSFSNAAHFEEWLLYEIIIPLNNFIQTVRKSIKNPSNRFEIYEILNEMFLEDIDNKDERIVQDLKFVCQNLAPFWETSV